MGLKYVSIDIETTGLDWDNHQIIEFGAVFEDVDKSLSFDNIPKFRAIIPHREYVGSAYAINLNQRIFKILADRPLVKSIDDFKKQNGYDQKHSIVELDKLASKFNFWLHNTMFGFEKKLIEPINVIVAGKNYCSFDKQFLKHVIDWDTLIVTGHRALDPAALFIDFKNDTKLPSLDVCLERSDIEQKVSHNAVYDAWDVIRVLRTKYGSTK